MFAIIIRVNYYYFLNITMQVSLILKAVYKSHFITCIIYTIGFIIGFI